MGGDSVRREWPRYAAAVTENLMSGGRRLRQAFLQTPMRFAVARSPIIHPTDREPSVVLLRNGFAFRSCYFPDGRRAIARVLAPGDFGGLDNIVLAGPAAEITAASRVGYHTLPAATVRALTRDHDIALTMLMLGAEAHLQGDRLTATIGRLDAAARIAVLLLDIHDRLFRRGFISRPTYNLPMTQEQVADHLGLTLVHVNRTLRRLREEGIAVFDRGVVIIRDIDRLREFASGLPQPAELAAELPAATSTTVSPIRTDA